MDKEQLWAIVVKRNPDLATAERVTLPAEKVKALFDLAWSNGARHGREQVQIELGVEGLRGMFGMK